jgi:IPT/TIG domain
VLHLYCTTQAVCQFDSGLQTPAQLLQGNATTCPLATNTALPAGPPAVTAAALVAAARSSNCSLARCTTPPHKSGAVSVMLSLDGAAFFGPVSYEYRQQLVPSSSSSSSISPVSGSAAGGTLLRIALEAPEPAAAVDAAAAVWCRFTSSSNKRAATIVVKGAYSSDGSAVLCSTPAWPLSTAAVTPAELRAAVAVSTNEQDFVHAGWYSYLAAAVLTGLTPAHGGVLGGANLQLFGRNFALEGGLQCVFTPMKAAVAAVREAVAVTSEATWGSPTELACTAPAAVAGDYTVSIRSSTTASTSSDITTSNSSTAAAAALVFTYRTLPQVAAVTPAYGPAAGGQWLAVSGTNFRRTGQLACHFGGPNDVTASSVPATWFSSTLVRCLSPAAASPLVGGSVSVSISQGPSERSTTSADYTTVPLLQLLSAAPAAGWSAGGGHVELTVGASPPGVDTAALLPLLRASFGSSSTPLLLNSSGDSASTSNSSAVAALKLGSAADSFDSSTSGDLAAVSAAAAVSVGALVPQLTAAQGAAVGLSLTWGEGGPAASNTLPFSVLAPIVVHSVTPTAGASAGGTTVRLTGENFIAPLRCAFGAANSTTTAVTVAAVVVSSSSVVCVTPAYPVGVAPVTVVTGEGLQAWSSLASYEFGSTAVALSAQPAVGPERGGTVVSVRLVSCLRKLCSVQSPLCTWWKIATYRHVVAAVRAV